MTQDNASSGSFAVGTFKAIRIDKAEKGTTVALTQFDEAELMDGDVTVRVEWSTLNYKDGLAVTGKAPVVRRFPMIAGIDFAGIVEQSTAPAVEGRRQGRLQRLGHGRDPSGRYAEKARVKGDWLVRLPESISTRDAMAIGTAGYTAMLSVLALEKHGLTPDERPGRRDRCCRRRRFGRYRRAVKARLSRHRLHRADVGSRLSEGPRRRRGDRPQRTVRRRQSRWQRSAGQAASTASGRPRSPICSR